MILFFYNLVLLIVLAVTAPWWLWKIATTHKYREGLLERFGWIRLRQSSRRASGFMPSRLAKCWPFRGWLASWIAHCRSASW